ncbi:MAG: laccase domain-containing protein [Candidatus Saccharibacteria bacterium]
MNVSIATSTVADGSMLTASDPANTTIIDNRARWLTSQGIAMNDATRVKISYQTTDYCRYFEVTDSQKGDGMFDEGTTAADALVTRFSHHALFLPLADCVGAAIYDPAMHILMLSHLGRHSLEQNGGLESVNYLVNRYGCDASRLKVWLTPAPGRKNYPLFAFDNRAFKDVVLSQLRAAGIRADNISDDSSDTTTDLRYFSHSQYLKGNRPEDGRYAIVASMGD